MLFELKRRAFWVKRGVLGRWCTPEDRADPVDLVEETHLGRLEHLIPVRVGRMVASPYAFLRGAAFLMAGDFQRMPRTGIEPVFYDDAHLGNFGFYASPERDLVFDLNDFDEAHPGPWEWDLWRVTASIWVADRQNGLTEGTCEDAVLWCAAAYRRQIAQLAGKPLLTRSFNRMDMTGCARRWRTGRCERRWSDLRISHACAPATVRSPKLTREHDGVRHILDQPPLVIHVSDEEKERLIDGLEAYLQTVPPHWRRVLSSHVVIEVAHKVVGVGSVGLRAFVVLLQGNDAHDVLFLQMKQARGSCVAPFVHGATAWHAPSGAAGRGVSADAADRQRPAPRLDHRRQTRLPRSPVPRHEGRGPRGRHGRLGPYGLWPDLRCPARQGPRPLNRRHDVVRLPRQGRRRRPGVRALRACLR
jgi:uncharacterized protein (DUF2252 family)